MLFRRVVRRGNSQQHYLGGDDSRLDRYRNVRHGLRRVVAAVPPVPIQWRVGHRFGRLYSCAIPIIPCVHLLIVNCRAALPRRHVRASHLARSGLDDVWRVWHVH